MSNETAMDLKAFKTTRPMTTLQQNSELVIQKGGRRSAFLFFFGNNTQARRPFWTMTSLVASHLLEPSVPLKGATRDTEKGYKSVYKAAQENWRDHGIGETVNVRKNVSDESFTVLVPILIVKDAPETFRNVCLFAGLDAGYEGVIRGTPGRFPISGVQGRGNISPKEMAEWKSCDAHLVVKVVSDKLLFMIEYRVSKAEAQHITNEKFEFIKPMDLYGVVFQWVSTYYGSTGRSPAFSIPLRQISRGVRDAVRSLPVEPRTNKENLIIDQHGEIFYLPSELDDIQRFEDLYTTHYASEQGVFGAIDLLSGGDFQAPKKAPPPMPVYVDWLNLKFAYTNGSGRLEVMNLDRTYPVNQTHMFRLLDKKLEAVERTLAQIIGLSVFYNIQVPSWKELSTDVQSDMNEHEGLLPGDIKLSDLMDLGTNMFGRVTGSVEVFRKACEELLSRLESSPEVAYARYSVPSILALRGMLRVMVNNWGKTLDLKKADEEARSAYRDQAPDPNYVLPKLPYISEGRGLLPHQGKVLSQSKSSPANVVYPVAAGGGKTMIYVVDMLREMGHFKTPGPYSIMCPAHLVAQYVKEIVYATDGRVNVIPVTSYTIRRHGFDRLQAMINASPVNTVLIVDYNVITLRARTLAYGTETIRIFPVVEFLRQFGIQVVYTDETHYLKSESARQQAAHRLIADIPKKRGASGTFVQDTIRDLVKQAALFDPSIFGTPEDFVRDYALEVRGSKVISWKPGTEALVKAVMKSNFIYGEAKRKEWAAILPKPVENFHKVDLSPRQLEVYNQILGEVIEALTAELEKNQALKDLLSPDPDADDDSPDVTIDQLLKPYLARLERFITAPGKDPLGAVALTGPELISPKVRQIVDLAVNHVNEGIPGKVLIFTNYTLSAEAIYESFPEDFRSQVILYTASEKEACGAQFEKDPSKTVMVGVEQSMNTGLNLQFASRLIRTETVWTPGVLEQGNARIGRPNIKVAEERSQIFYDWIIANHTIDVTKISYLMAKTISAAKYEEAGNPRFDDLEVPPLFSMTLDTIQAANDFDTTMLDYFDKYAAYKQAVFAEYAEFREKNKDVLFTKDGKLKMIALERGENLPDSKLLRRVPYVPGTELYAADQLGLVRYDAYMRLNLEESEAEGEGEEEEEGDDIQDNTDPEKAAALGLAVHTDRGDGEIVRVGKKRITALLPSGERVSVNKMSAFIITRDETSQRDIRTHLLKMVGDVPLDAPLEVLESQVTEAMQRKLERQRIREEKSRKAEPIVLDISFTVVNDILGMRVDNVEDDDRVADVAQQYGFRFSPEYYAAPINTPQHMLRLFKAWSEAGYSIPKENNEVCRAVYNRMNAKGRKALPSTFGFASPLDLRNFYLHEFKPNPKDDVLMPYPMVQEGILYVALPSRAHPASLKAIRAVKVPGIRWAKYEASAELVLFPRTKEAANKVIRRMIEDGIKFADIEGMRKQFRSLKVVRDHE